MQIDVLKFKIKRYVPGLRKRWPNLIHVLSHWANVCAKEFSFEEENGMLVAKKNKYLKLYGFANTYREEKLMIMMQNDPLFRIVDKKYFRLITDIICRYKFSHLRPDLNPQIVKSPNKDTEYMEGFHGQHRDNIMHINDIKLKKKLLKIFTPNKDDVILDCGTFLGFGAIAMSPTLKNGKIISFEASEKCFQVLKRNIQSNNIKNVEIVKGAVWSDESTKMNLITAGVQANSLIKNLIESTTSNKVTKEVVDCISIDSIVSSKNIKKIDMISLTLNGAEVEALSGAIKTLTNLRPRIRLAGWYKRKDEYICDICKRYLEKLNYFVYIGKKRGVLAVPKEKLS